MILAIDASTQWIGIALFDGNLIQYEKIWKASQRHTVELSPAISAAFQESGTSVNDLQAVAVAIGPGSFTSLRIGLSLAKGFSLSRHIPIIAVPSLDIYANGIPPRNEPLVCVLRAGRGRLAAQRYLQSDGRWQSAGDLVVTTAEELEESITEPTLICGELEEEEKKVIQRRWRNALIVEPPMNIRRPSVLAWMASERLARGDVDDSASIAPIYLRTVKNVDH
jgi:tRNA threonylcarbamoyladenosine biosynthesis protein TsaB